LFIAILFILENMTDHTENNYKTSPLDSKSEICFSDVSHPKELLTVLNSLRTNEQLCDVTLLVGLLRIPCHKAVLSASSPYFQAMFTGTSIYIPIKKPF